MKKITGNTFRIYPTVKELVNELNSGEQGVVAQIGLSGMRKAQKKFLKKRWRIKQCYATGAVDRTELRLMLKEAQLELLCNFSCVTEHVLNRIATSDATRGTA